jgi:hypothetical protein
LEGLYFKASPGKKVTETPHPEISQAWYCISVISAMWEVLVVRSKACPGPKLKTLSEKQLNGKRAGSVASV